MGGALGTVGEEKTNPDLQGPKTINPEASTTTVTNPEVQVTNPEIQTTVT